MAPASTGRDNRSSTAVIITDQTNSVSLSNNIFDRDMFDTVEIKFTAPRIDEIPAR